MKQFKDSAGRTWDIVVNVGTAKKVRDLTTVNLFDLYSDEAKRVFGDPCLLVNVLYVLCEKQCRERGVSDEQFGEGMVGDAIEDAATALLHEVADFFPESRRQLLRKQMSKSQQIAEQMTAKAMDALDKLDATQLLSSTKSRAS